VDDTAKTRSAGRSRRHLRVVARNPEPVVADAALDARVAVAQARLREALRGLLEVIDDLGGRRRRHPVRISHARPRQKA